MNKFLLFSFMLTLWAASSQAQSYCTTGLYTSGCTSGDDIDDFSLGSFTDTATGCSGTGSYNDFTSDTITVTNTVPQPLEVTNNYGGLTLRLFVDFNTDGDFDDVGEEIYVSPNAFGASTPLLDTITFPSGTPTGTFRLRVRGVWLTTAFTACSSQSYGEIHDYTINIEPNISGGCANYFSNWAVDSISGTSAKVEWTPGSGNASFYLEYDTAGFTPGTGTTITGTYPGSQPPVILTGLSSNATYDVYFGEICNSGSDSAYFNLPQQFTTTGACAPVTSFTITDTNSFDVELSWLHAGASSNYTIIYDTAGFNPATGGNTLTATASPYSVTGLSQYTLYDFYVISNCGSGLGSSDTVGPISVRTICAPFTAPYTNGFENDILDIVPGCWAGYANASSAFVEVEDFTGTAAPYSGSQALYLYSGSGTTSDTLVAVSPQFTDLTAGNKMVHFYANADSDDDILYVGTVSSQNVGATFTPIDTITFSQADTYKEVYVSFTTANGYNGTDQYVALVHNNGATFEYIRIDEFSYEVLPPCLDPYNFNVLSVYYDSVNIAFDNPDTTNFEYSWGPTGFNLGTGTVGTASGNPFGFGGLSGSTTYDVYVRINCSGSGNGFSNWAGPFTFTTTPSCSDPTNISASGITPYAANISANFFGNLSTYQYEYGPTGFTQGNGTSVDSTANPYQITGLTDNTFYDVYVRVICGDPDTTAWVGPLTFKTACLPVSAPILETFESNSNTVGCWSNEYVTGTFDWTINTGSTGGSITNAYSGSQNARFVSTSTNASTRFLSPIIDMSGLTTPALKFWYGQEDWAGDQNYLNVYMRASATAPWTLIFSDSTNKASWTEADILLSGVSATTQFAFEGINNYGRANVLDDVAFYDQVPADFELLSAEFKKDYPCYSNADTIEFGVIHEVGAQIDFAITPLTIQFDIAGPVNTTGTATLSTGTSNIGDTTYFSITNVDLSIPGDYILQSTYLDSNGINQDKLNDTLLSQPSITVDSILSVKPSYYTLINASDSVKLQASSPFFGGGSFFFSEISHYIGFGSGPGTVPTWLGADDYIEITGVPGSDLGGIVYEEWQATLVNTYTFPAGTIIGPNGTCIIGVGTLGGSSDPTNYYYEVGYSDTWSSGDDVGRILKDANDNIIDAVGYDTYTFPTASGVTTADWSGTVTPTSATAGIRLIADDNNTATNWAVVGSGGLVQDVNVLNANISLPNPATISGFSWSLNGVVVDTSAAIMVYADSLSTGTYDYIATFVTPCGIYTDTATVYLGTCFPPLNLTADSISGMAAKLSWTTQSSGSIHQLEYGASGFTPGSGTLLTTATDSSHVVTGLTPQTTYCYYVRTICGVADTSGWAGPYCFTTSVSCPPSSNFIATPLTNSSISLNWTPGNGSVAYNIEYGQAGFTVGSGTMVSTSTIPLVINGLSANTNYDFYLIDSCGVGNSSVTTLGPISAKTFCNTITAPYLETFETTSPTVDCWTNEFILGTQSWSVGTGSTGGSISSSYSGTQNAVFTSTSGTSVSRFISPVVDLSALTSPSVSFYYAQENWAGDQNYLNVYFRAHPDSAWAIIFSDSTEQTSYTLGLASLPSNSATAQIALEGIDNWGRGTVVDDIEFFENTCPPSTNFNALNVFTDSVQLEWTAPSSSIAFIIEYDTAGFTPGTGNIIVATSSPFTITGLNPATDYDFYLLDSCGIGNSSSLKLGPLSVTTPCTAYSLPYFEDFSSSTDIPNCYAGYNNSGSTLANAFWRFAGTWPAYGAANENNAPGSAGGSLGVDGSTPSDSAVTLETPLFDLSGAIDPWLKFKKFQNNTNTSENMLLFVNFFDGAVWHDSVIVDSANNASWIDLSFNIGSYTIQGDIKFQFVVNKYTGDEGTSSAFYSDILVDDIEVFDSTAAPAPCLAPTAVTGTATCDSITINWTGAKDTALVTYGTGTNFSSLLVNDSTFTIGGLTPGTAYTFAVSNICNGDTSAPTGTTLSTATGPLPVASFVATDTVDNGDGTWTVLFDASASTGASTYRWDFGNGTSGTGMNTSATFSAGSYTVILTVTNGCGTDTASFTQSFSGLNDNAISRSLNVYPNPTRHMVNITFDGASASKATIRLMDASGREVIRLDENINGRYDGQLDVSRLSKGIYLIEIQSGDLRAQRRLSVN